MIISIGYRVKSKNTWIFRKKIKLIEIATRVDDNLNGDDINDTQKMH